MRKSVLAACAVLTVASACSPAAEDNAGTPSGDLSASSVDELVTAVEDDGWTCVGADIPVSLRACIGEPVASNVLYVFYGDDEEPERVFVSYAYQDVFDDAVDTLLPAVPADDIKEVQFEDDVVQFGDVAVRGGDHLVIANTAELAEQPFPEMPQVDADAVAASLEQAYGVVCEGTSPQYECDTGGVFVEVGPGVSIVDDSPPVAIAAEIDQEFTSDDKFAGVPEFFDAAGMPLTAQAQQLIADCQGDGSACNVTFVNDSGLLVQISPGASTTNLHIDPMTPVA